MTLRWKSRLIVLTRLRPTHQYSVEMQLWSCDVSQLIKHRFRSVVENTKQPGALGSVMSLLIEAPAVYGNRHRAVKLYVSSKPLNMILSKEKPNAVISKDRADKQVLNSNKRSKCVVGGSLVGKAVIQALNRIQSCTVQL